MFQWLNYINNNMFDEEIQMLKDNAMCYRLMDGSLIITEEIGEDPDNDYFLTGIQVEIHASPQSTILTPYSIPGDCDTLVELYRNSIISRFKPQKYLLDHFAAFIFKEAAEDVQDEYD
jgi:hypothetical protein